VDLSEDFDILVDAMFGFSFHGNYLSQCKLCRDFSMTVYTYKCLNNSRLLLYILYVKYIKIVC
jgi:hypothetical protein